MPERRFGSYNASTAEPSAVAKERILLVDPDDDSRTMYREWFQESGCEVVEAIDGREALTEALVRPPALVISEIRLPFIDGHALCEILRRDWATARIPILLVTSDGRTSELARAKAAGASAGTRQAGDPGADAGRVQTPVGGHGTAVGARGRDCGRSGSGAGAAVHAVHATNVEVAGPYLDDDASARSAAGSLSVVRPPPHVPAQPHRRRQ